MLFNSYPFVLLFLPIALAGWWSLRGDRVRFIWITLASYVFYASWNWRFLPLMILSTTIDYVAGCRIAAAPRRTVRRAWLVGALSANLALLAFFKYAGFIASTVNGLAEAAGVHAFVPILTVVLPIGISFYTFNSMSYTIDVYRGTVKPARSPWQYSAFVALFPHLIAGPIVRYSDLEAQFQALRRHLSSSDAGLGIQFFVLGLVKKLLIADRLAGPVDMFFAAPPHPGLLNAWAAVLGYTFQIYFDFSGYSDMAVGLAWFLGLRFPQNFNSPYQATDISDFWRRWHISLSTWIRDYVYFPLGGSRTSRARTTFNLAVTMFLVGLWHGANWTFVAWGLYHGALLALRGMARARGITIRSPVLSRAATFLCVAFGWVLFRADTFTQAGSVLAEMSGASGFGPLEFSKRYAAILLGAGALAFLAPNTWQIAPRPTARYAWLLAAAMVTCILLFADPRPFLYFQF